MTGLHQRDSVNRFNDRVADYVRYRPSYPAAAIDAILDGLGDPSGLRAADIGAGTGISARLLGDRGVDVTAVEPGKAMRSAAEPHSRVAWHDGTAESTGLAPDTFDLVVCAQSFHWFDARRALPEFARILRPNGRLVIMWNRRSQTDPFTAGYRQAILDVGGEPESERLPFDPDVIAGFFSVPTLVRFPNVQRLDREGLRGRARSASYVPKTGAAGERFVELLDALFDRFVDASGHVTLVYDTEVYRAPKVPMLT